MQKRYIKGREKYFLRFSWSLRFPEDFFFFFSLHMREFTGAQNCVFRFYFIFFLYARQYFCADDRFVCAFVSANDENYTRGVSNFYERMRGFPPTPLSRLQNMNISILFLLMCIHYHYGWGLCFMGVRGGDELPYVLLSPSVGGVGH